MEAQAWSSVSDTWAVLGRQAFGEPQPVRMSFLAHVPDAHLKEHAASAGHVATKVLVYDWARASGTSFAVVLWLRSTPNSTPGSFLEASFGVCNSTLPARCHYGDGERLHPYPPLHPQLLLSPLRKRRQYLKSRRRSPSLHLHRRRSRQRRQQQWTPCPFFLRMLRFPLCRRILSRSTSYQLSPP